ncbi:MAG TPA: HrpE/YscL family type III secretion apparatus protein [Leucothrix mucor]|uniref:Flagellar assembly protein FliH n=1 Tax=Leucothrix mucor TaxID=45248 RepID=A0A7V2T346_LEUMU|nr:HrpE/YscL family type III secretion apparatus protein [Leucothrix mucor]
MSNFIKIKSLETELKSGEKIIKAHDYAYFIKSELIAKEAEEKKRKGELAATEALLKAVQNGIAQGEEESRKQLSEQMLKASSDTLEQLAKVEKDLLDVVINAVRKIIENYDDDKLALAMVRNGLKLVCKSQRVIVRVNPKKMDKLMQGLMSLNQNIDFLEIMPDENLSGVDCVLESDIGIVRASLEEQLQHIENSIKTALPS